MNNDCRLKGDFSSSSEQTLFFLLLAGVDSSVRNGAALLLLVGTKLSGRRTTPREGTASFYLFAFDGKPLNFLTRFRNARCCWLGRVGDAIAIDAKICNLHQHLSPLLECRRKG